MYRILLGCFTSLVLGACVSLPRTTPAPRFPLKTLYPVGIRLVDERPGVQRGNVLDPEWIYFQAQGSEQSDLLANYLGNALVALNAAPGYVLLDAEAPWSSARVIIELDYLKGYSRWPVDTNQMGNEIPVEGRTQIRYRIYVDGEKTAQGKMTEAPDDFRVPVGIIRQSNVRQVVSDALAYQFDRATTDLLDEFIWRVADAWPTTF